jgi:proton glutamate symport protein
VKSPAETDTGAPGQRRSRAMLLALVVGGVLGWLVPELAAWLKPIGGLFVRLMEMLLAPLLITTLVGWSAQAVKPSVKRGAWRVAKLALVSLACFTLASTAAMFIGTTAANVIKPLQNGNDTKAKKLEGKEAEAKNAERTSGSCMRPTCSAAHAGWTSAQATTTSEQAGKQAAQSARDQFGEFLQNLVPASIFQAFHENGILQIVVFSVLMGMAIGAVCSSARVARVKGITDTGAAALYKLVDYAMYAAPFGVGAASAATFGATAAPLGASTSSIVPLLECVAGLYGALMVFLALIIGLMILVIHITKDRESGRARIDWKKFLVAIREPALLAFATATSKAALPRAMQKLTELGISKRVVSFVIPAGFSLNLAGSTLFLPFAAMVVAQHAGVDNQLSWGGQLLLVLTLTLSSKNIVGIPGVSFCVLSALLLGPNSPIAGADQEAVTEALCALACVDTMMDMGRTCTNVVGNCVVTVLVALAFDDDSAPDIDR